MVAMTGCTVNIFKCILPGNKTSYSLSFLLIELKLYTLTYLLYSYLHAIKRKNFFKTIQKNRIKKKKLLENLFFKKNKEKEKEKISKKNVIKVKVERKMKF